MYQVTKGFGSFVCVSVKLIFSNVYSTKVDEIH